MTLRTVPAPAPPQTPFAAMIEAKAELRAIAARHRDKALPMDPADSARREELLAVVARVEAPETLEGEAVPAPPSLAELRAELHQLETVARERHSADADAHRQEALAAWAARRERMAADAQRIINHLANDAIEGVARPVTGLADLLAGSDEETDQRVRARIEAMPIRPQRIEPGRMGELRRQIAAKEAEGLPTAAQQRQQRLAALVNGAPS